MEIYATPCNGKQECADNSDESGCDNSSTSNLVLTILLLTILFMFLFLTYIGGFNIKSNKLPKITPLSNQELLQKCKKEINNSDFVKELNLHLHHSIQTKSVQQNMDTFVRIFDLIAEKHKNCESKMHIYFHKNLDPLLVQEMFDIKFPGIFDLIMKKLSKMQLFTKIINLIEKTENMKKMIKNLTAVIKIELKYSDIFKDLGLSILMLDLIGGPHTIIIFPTTFGSAVVICMFTSIFIPMLISCLHLAMNNFAMILPIINSKTFKIPKALKVFLMFLLFPFQPVFLETHYIETEEEADALAKNYHKEAVEKKQYCRKIKKQFINFVKIELGKAKANHHLKASKSVSALYVCLYILFF